MSNTTDLSSVEILFDNGGGVTLQTASYAHLYDEATDAARDYMVLVSGGNTADWEGNDPYAEITQYSGYQFYDHEGIQAIIKAGEHQSSVRSERDFFRALGVTIEG